MADIHAQNSKQAVHWLRPEVVQSVIFAAKTPSLVVACGYAMTGYELKHRTTVDIEQVSCAECLVLCKSQQSTHF
jgi:hypothetical protein